MSQAVSQARGRQGELGLATVAQKGLVAGPGQPTSEAVLMLQRRLARQLAAALHDHARGKLPLGEPTLQLEPHWYLQTLGWVLRVLGVHDACELCARLCELHKKSAAEADKLPPGVAASASPAAAAAWTRSQRLQEQPEGMRESGLTRTNLQRRANARPGCPPNVAKNADWGSVDVV